MIPKIELMSSVAPLGSFCHNDLFFTLLSQRLFFSEDLEIEHFEYKIGAGIYEDYCSSFAPARTVVYV